jgi:hypothetical protein
MFLKYKCYCISQGSDLNFMISGKTAFELPLRYVANSNIAGKTEVSMEFSNLSPTPTGAKSMGDELTEIRFFVPGNFSKLKGSDAGSEKSDDEDAEEISAAQVFHDTIKEKAEIGQVTGDLILSFEEVLVLTPRGRYDMDMFPSFLRLRGKTYDYKVLYQSIARLFLLPKDDQHVLFIVSIRFLFQIPHKYQLIIEIAVGSQHAHPTRSNTISIPGDAVYARRGDHGRVKHERVSVYEMQQENCRSYLL